MYENMYEKHVAIIVNRFGGFRERTIFKNPHTIEKTETWNKEHKVLPEAEPVPLFQSFLT